MAVWHLFQAFIKRSLFLENSTNILDKGKLMRANVHRNPPGSCLLQRAEGQEVAANERQFLVPRRGISCCIGYKTTATLYPEHKALACEITASLFDTKRMRLIEAIVLSIVKRFRYKPESLAPAGAEVVLLSKREVTRPVHADCPVRFGWPAASVKAACLSWQ